EPAPREAQPRAASAEVDDRSEPLLLLERRVSNPRARQRLGDAPVEIRGRHLDRVRRHEAVVERIEPARIEVVPRAVLDDLVVVNAIAARLAERAVRDLIHADGARRGPIDLEGLDAEPEAPIRAHDRIARAFDLR